MWQGPQANSLNAGLEARAAVEIEALHERAPETDRTPLGPALRKPESVDYRIGTLGLNGPVLTATDVRNAIGLQVSRASSGGATRVWISALYRHIR